MLFIKKQIHNNEMKINNLLSIIKSANKQFIPFNNSNKITCLGLKQQLIRAYQQGYCEDEYIFGQMMSWLKTNIQISTDNEVINTFLPEFRPMQLSIYYLETAIRFMGSNKMTKYSYYIIGQNLFNILYWEKDEMQVQEETQNLYHIGRQAFLKYLEFHSLNLNNFDSYFQMKILKIASYLKIYHPGLMQYVKDRIQTQQTKHALNDIMICLVYLAEDRCFPYQFFYSNKSNWISLIQSSDKFSKSRVLSAIKFMQIMSKQRFIHCEKIMSRLIQVLMESEAVMEISELIRTLFYYSKAKYGISAIFIRTIIQRIIPNIQKLNQRQYGMLVMSFSNLNYQNQTLIIQLTFKNYQLFVALLRLNCKHLGPYYKLILEQIDKDAKKYQPNQRQSKTIIPDQAKNNNQGKSQIHQQSNFSVEKNIISIKPQQINNDCKI